jgi:hypothetical protein
VNRSELACVCGVTIGYRQYYDWGPTGCDPPDDIYHADCFETDSGAVYCSAECFERTNGRCSIHQEVELDAEDGSCSECGGSNGAN